MTNSGTGSRTQIITMVKGEHFHAGWIKSLATIFFFLFSVSVSAGQVIDFGNVTPDQGNEHSGPIIASGPDGVQVTVEFINIETANVVESGLYSAQDCTGTNFDGVFFTGDATAGCATSNLFNNKHAVRLTFSEPVDISRIDLSKFNDFDDDGSNWNKEVRFFEGTPTTTFTTNEGDNSAPTNYDFSGLMDMSANQAITEFSVGFTQVTQVWFYAAYVNIPDFPTFDGVAVAMNWVVDQIHYGEDAEAPTVTTAIPSSIHTNSATLGGNVIDSGGEQVTVRGVVYSTSPNPTTDDNVVQIGVGTGSFSQNVTGLNPGTTYYVRAFATNAVDTGYGSQQSFTTLVGVESIVRHDPASSLTNAGSVVYQVNLSGPVVGLSNINFTLSTSGVFDAFVSNVTGSGSSYFVTVNTGSGDGIIGLILNNSTGVSPNIISLPFTGGETYTIDKTPPAVNISSTEDSPTDADPIPVTFTFNKDVTGFVIGDISASGGTLSNFSGGGSVYTVDITPTSVGTITVDVPAGVAQDAAGNDNTAASQFSIDFSGIDPTVSTSDPSSITATSATMGGDVTSEGSTSVSERGIVWGLTPNPNIDDDFVTEMGSGPNEFSGTVHLLPMGTTIYYRAFATSSVGTSYGSNQSFTTLNSTSVTLENPTGFRLLASPVSVAYNELLSTIWTQGADGANTSAGNPNVFTWDNSSPNNESDNWFPVEDLTTSIPEGTGLLVYVFELDDHDDPGSGNWPKTLTVSGSETTGTIEPDMNSNENGWTLIGNPYASFISFSELNPQDILANTLYVWDLSEGSWKTWNANSNTGDITDGIIAPFQGFLVQSAAGSPSVTFSQSSKTTDEGAGFHDVESDDFYRIRLQLSGQDLKNAVWVTFSDQGSDMRNDGDALKLQPLSHSYALLSTQKENGAMLDIGSFPLPDDGLEIPIAVESTEKGRYTLSATDFTLPPDIELYITDLEHQVSLPLDQNFSYAFTISETTQTESGLLEKVQDGSVTTQIPASTRFVITTSTPTSIPDDPSGDLPQKISLAQNYPNPFNPTTVISYELPESGDVRLDVFDLTGRQVATLVNGLVRAGSHQITFDAGSLSSGIYIYRLLTGGTTLTRKLTLIK